jgi:hypothetical protein
MRLALTKSINPKESLLGIFGTAIRSLDAGGVYEYSDY